VGTNPEQRLARLIRHVVQGWARAKQDADARRRACTWLTAHPSAMPEVDALWQEALSGRGPLAAWIEAGAVPAGWHHDLALHSVLCGHPFTDLPQWTEVRK
jgi:hypothetical protein